MSSIFNFHPSTLSWISGLLLHLVHCFPETAFSCHQWELNISKSNSYSLISSELTCQQLWIPPMIQTSLIHFLYMVASIPQNFPTLLSSTFLHLASRITLGFPRALSSALSPLCSPLVIFSHYLMALNMAWASVTSTPVPIPSLPELPAPASSWLFCTSSFQLAFQIQLVKKMRKEKAFPHQPSSNHCIATPFFLLLLRLKTLQSLITSLFYHNPHLIHQQILLVLTAKMDPEFISITTCTWIVAVAP